VHKQEGAITVQPFRNAKRSLHFRKIRGQWKPVGLRTSLPDKYVLTMKCVPSR
jgi:hypothetical protein